LGIGSVLSINQYFPIPTGFLLLLQPLITTVLSILLKQAPWWWFIHLLFMPAVVGVMLNINLPAWVYLGFFLVFLSVFWGTVKGDVPLFLSSSPVVDTVIKCVKQEHATSFVDLGAGVGTVIIPLAQSLPNLAIVGLERAPIPYLLALWRCRAFKNIQVQSSSFWFSNLHTYSVGFAFLSPLVMPRLGQKISQEMQVGSLFISAEFPIPEWRPESIIESTDLRKTRIFCYRIGISNKKK
jgi:hypothetical protein